MHPLAGPERAARRGVRTGAVRPAVRPVRFGRGVQLPEAAASEPQLAAVEGRRGPAEAAAHQRALTHAAERRPARQVSRPGPTLAGRRVTQVCVASRTGSRTTFNFLI